MENVKYASKDSITTMDNAYNLMLNWLASDKLIS